MASEDKHEPRLEVFFLLPFRVVASPSTSAALVTHEQEELANMASTSASMDPQRLATALERTKVEARESARSLRIVQRKLDSATEEAEARIKSEKEKLVQLHRAELAEVKSKFEREHVALKEANEAKRGRATTLDDDDEDEEMAEQLEETTFLLTQARSENARLQQEAEKVTSLPFSPSIYVQS